MTGISLLTSHSTSTARANESTAPVPLTIKICDKANETIKQCNICLKEWTGHDRIAGHGNHFYCLYCIDTWKQYENNCPECRVPFEGEELHLSQEALDLARKGNHQTEEAVKYQIRNGSKQIEKTVKVLRDLKDKVNKDYDREDSLETGARNFMSKVSQNVRATEHLLQSQRRDANFIKRQHERKDQAERRELGLYDWQPLFGAKEEKWDFEANPVNWDFENEIPAGFDFDAPIQRSTYTPLQSLVHLIGSQALAQQTAMIQAVRRGDLDLNETPANFDFDTPRHPPAPTNTSLHRRVHLLRSLVLALQEAIQAVQQENLELLAARSIRGGIN